MRPLITALAFLPLLSFGQKKSPGMYGQLGILLENGKYIGGKLNVGLFGKKKNGDRGFGAGAGIDYIHYKYTYNTAFAVPVYIDLRQFMSVGKQHVFIDGNLGAYNYKYKLITTENFGNQGSVTSEAKSRNTLFAGVNLGFIVPLKSTSYNGIAFTVGYRRVPFTTDFVTTEIRRATSGGPTSTTVRNTTFTYHKDYVHASLSISL